MLVHCHAGDGAHRAVRVVDWKTGTTFLAYTHGDIIWLRRALRVIDSDSDDVLTESDGMSVYIVAREPRGDGVITAATETAIRTGRLIPVFSETWATPQQVAAGLAKLPVPPTVEELLSSVPVPATPAAREPAAAASPAVPAPERPGAAEAEPLRQSGFWTGQEAHPFAFPGIVGAGLALIALSDMPYGYYPFLRAAMMALAVILGIVAGRSGRGWWALLSLGLFIFFAPAEFIPLTRAGWVPVDLLTAALFCIAAGTIPGPKLEKGDDGGPKRRLRGFTITVIVGVLVGGGMYSTAYGSGSGGDPDCVTMYDTRGAYCG